MVKRLIRFSVRLGAVVALVAIVLKVLEDRDTPTPIAKVEPEPEPEPTVAWVEPQGAVCPPSHPVKAKLSSKVYRTPATPGYASSKPDRCYASADAAQGDGLREAKR
jgi:hypothetical protein